MAAHPGAAVLRLPALLDTQAAPALLRTLSDQRGHDVELDGSAVQRLGGLCLQVLLSAGATWQSDACSLVLTEPSPELQAGMTLLGVDPASPLMQQEHHS